MEASVGWEVLGGMSAAALPGKGVTATLTMDRVLGVLPSGWEAACQAVEGDYCSRAGPDIM